MASSTPKIRFVRCPKCLRLLTEFADVPMYQCGGCGATLRSKYHNSSTENVTVGSSSTDRSQNLPYNSSLMNGSTSLGKQMLSSSESSSSKVDHKQEKGTHPKFYTSCSNVEQNYQEKGEFSKSEENDTEGKGNTKSIIQSQSDGSIQIKSKYVMVEEVDKSKCSQPDYDNMAVNDKMEESANPINRRAALEKHMVDEEVGIEHLVHRSPTTRSSQAYDSSMSSSDDGSADTKSNKYLLLSRRTFRRKWILDSVDTKTQVEGENISRSYLSSANAEKQANSISRKSRNEERGSGMRGSFYSKKDAHDWGITFGSEDFQSVENYVETESYEPPQTQNNSPSTEFMYLEDDPLELLRNVDELRDQLSRLCDRRVEGKAGSHCGGTHCPIESYTSRDLMPQMTRFSQLPVPGQHYCSCLQCLPPHLCNYDGLCGACPYNHSPKAATKSNSSSCCHKAPNHDYEMDKMHHKDTKPAAKRYCRPVSGGAPFTICYKCLELLQLPADFLVSRRRSHKLQCGACSEVIMFPYLASAHMVPQTPVEEVHLASGSCRIVDVDDRGDPLSYTEEHGPSFSKSYSTDAEISVHAPGNSFEAIEERNGEQASGMALHRLMGYPSAREILHQPSYVSEGYESSEIEMQYSYRPSEESHASYRPEGRGANFMFHENSSKGASPNSERHEEDESPERLRIRRGAVAHHGLVRRN